MNDFNIEDIDSKPTLEDALEELRSKEGNMPSPAVLYGLSGLSSSDLKTLEPVWDNLDATYRRVLMQMMVDAMDENFELNFRPIALANLDATQAEVRQASIEMLWEDNRITLMDRFIGMAQHDPSNDVRLEAIKALGRFVLAGELGDVSEEQTIRAQDYLISVFDDLDEDNNLRQHALEGIGNCTRNGISQRIQIAFDSDDTQLRQGAVVAMGHTCDADKWGDTVLNVLMDGDIDLRRRAAKAAGELQLTEAVPALLRLLEEDEREGQEIVIWSLGEIGGKEAVRILESIAEMAEEVDDDALLDIVDDAIGNASLMSGDLILMSDFAGFDLDD